VWVVSGLLESAFLLPTAAKFFWMFGEKAGIARFFTKHPSKKQASSRRLRGL
jgi:hypothetical protein